MTANNADGANGGNQRGNFWLYVWLGLSGLMNIAGLSSLVGDLVQWADFFQHNFIDTYRWIIRDPLTYVGNAIWPFGTIPYFVVDFFVVWSAFLLAFNVYTYRDTRKTFIGAIYNIFRKDGFGQGMLTVFILLPGFLLIGPIIVLLPLLLGLIIPRNNPSKQLNVRLGIGIITNFFYILGLFILILLINWQIKKLGG
jgi:hypothetical protein